MPLSNPTIIPPSASNAEARIYSVIIADLAGLGAFTTGKLILDTLPSGTIITLCRVRHTQAIVGPGITGGTAQVTTANNNYGAAPLNIFLAPSFTHGTGLVTDLTPKNENIGSTTELDLSLTSIGANFSVVTAGAILVEIRIKVLDTE